MSRNRVLRRTGRRCGNNFAPHVSVADVEATKCFWGGLTVDEKLIILYFEDPVLVGRVFTAQQELSRSDMLCYQLGIRGQDATRARVGMDQFNLECCAGSMSPVAFYAKREFVERDDLFEHLEHRLGDSFLRKRPPVHRRDWPSTLEPAASSWADFMGQILRLVVMAILQAQLDANSTTGKVGDKEKEDSSAPTRPVVEMGDAEAVADSCDEAAAAIEALNVAAKPQSRSSKKKAKKKRANTANAIVLDVANTATTDDLTTSLDLPDDNAASESSERPADVDPVEPAGSICDTLSAVPVIEGESSLNFDWSVPGPPVDPAVESKVELQVDWSSHGPRLPETRWSAWLPSAQNGAAEWHWIEGVESSLAGGRRGLRAFIRNTFVDVGELQGEEKIGTRARSLPAAAIRRLRLPDRDVDSESTAVPDSPGSPRGFARLQWLR